MAKVPMVLTQLLVMVAAAGPAALAKDIKVGGTSLWLRHVYYAEWAQGITFVVGDTVVFEYISTHMVDVVDKEEYDNCDADGATESFHGGETKIKLEKPGPMHFIGSTKGHCPPMKLAINVEDSSSPSRRGSPRPFGASPEPAPSSETETGTTPSSDNEASKAIVSFGALAAAGVLGLVAA